MLPTSLFYFPKSFHKNFQNFSSQHFQISTSHFSMFENCNCQSFLISELHASALLVTFVENELSLEL